MPIDDAVGLVDVVELLDDIHSEGEEGGDDQCDAVGDYTNTSHDVIAAAGSIDEKNLSSCSGVVEDEAEGVYSWLVRRDGPQRYWEILFTLSPMVRSGE